MSDLNCPYCNSENEVCHDDGEGYEEDVRHEMECRECEKYFVFATQISFDYKPSKADCLNDGNHRLKESITYPERFTRMQCQECSYAEKLPDSHPFLKEPE